MKLDTSPTAESMFFNEAEKIPAFSKEVQKTKAIEIFELHETNMQLALSIAQTNELIVAQMETSSNQKYFRDNICKYSKTMEEVTLTELKKVKKTIITTIQYVRDNPAAMHGTPLFLITEPYYLCGTLKFLVLERFIEIVEEIKKLDAVVLRALKTIENDSSFDYIKATWLDDRASKKWVHGFKKTKVISLDHIWQQYNEIEKQCCLKLGSVLANHKSISSNNAKIRVKTDQLVGANLKLVIGFAKESCNDQNQLMDVIQEGNMGLMHATKHFNPYWGYEFSTYASMKIKRAIQKYFINFNSVIKVPLLVANDFRKITNALDGKSSVSVNIDEISEKSKLDPERVNELLMNKVEVVSMNSLSTPSSHGGADRGSLLEVIEDERVPCPVENQWQSDRISVLEKLKEALTPEEKTIIELRTSGNRGSALPLREFKNRTNINLSGEMIRQKQITIVQKLKKEAQKHV